MIYLQVSSPCRKPDLLKICTAVFIALLLSCLRGTASGQGVEAYKWSVQYIIDQSQPVFGRPQVYFPRQNRGLAVSPDGRYLYAGYNRSGSHPSQHKEYEDAGEVRKIDLRVSDYVDATLRIVVGPRGKAIAVDDEGRVYLANGSNIAIYDGNLSEKELEIPTSDCEGVAVTREGGSLVLYSTERKTGILNRWILQKTGRKISDATLNGFADGTGQLTIQGARNLRGIALDRKGRIWIADFEGGKVFRVDKNGSNLAFVEVQMPLALSFDGEKCYVTQYTKDEITIIDENLNPIGTLSVPWAELELSATGNEHTGGLAGIAVIPGGKGFYVANEGGQTANQKSTYGRRDQYTDFVNGKLYMDCQNDDNEPILHAVPVVSAP